MQRVDVLLNRFRNCGIVEIQMILSTLVGGLSRGTCYKQRYRGPVFYLCICQLCSFFCMLVRDILCRHVPKCILEQSANLYGKTLPSEVASNTDCIAVHRLQWCGGFDVVLSGAVSTRDYFSRRLHGPGFDWGRGYMANHCANEWMIGALDGVQDRYLSLPLELHFPWIA
jgi:hypothetical protein